MAAVLSVILVIVAQNHLRNFAKTAAEAAAAIAVQGFAGGVDCFLFCRADYHICICRCLRRNVKSVWRKCGYCGRGADGQCWTSA